MKKRTVVAAMKNAREKGYAMPAFNIFNYASAKGVIEASEEMDTPIIIQVSTGTVKDFGIMPLFHLLKPLMDAAKTDIFLNLDHCTSVEFAKECASAGWDMVMFDGSKLSLEDNIAKTKEIAEYAQTIGAAVEGELGTIAGVEEDIVAEKGEAATFEECKRYIEESKVHILAPAVGTAHGVYAGVPKLNFDLVKQLNGNSDIPVVIHGGTGLAEEDFKNFVSCGACKINISTAIKHAYLDGMKEYLEKHVSEYKPLDADAYVVGAIREVAKAHIEMFRV